MSSMLQEVGHKSLVTCRIGAEAAVVTVESLFLTVVSLSLSVRQWSLSLTLSDSGHFSQPSSHIFNLIRFISDAFASLRHRRVLA